MIREIKKRVKKGNINSFSLFQIQTDALLVKASVFCRDDWNLFHKHRFFFQFVLFENQLFSSHKIYHIDLLSWGIVPDAVPGN